MTPVNRPPSVLLPYHLDEHRPGLDVPVPPDVTVTAALPAGDAWQRMAVLYEQVAATVRTEAAGGRTVVVQSGDCTTSLGVVAGLQRAGHDPSIVWFDAHGDVQTLETTESGYLGGIPLRLLTGYRPELVADALGLTPVAEDRVVLAGARDLDPPEREYLESSALRRCAVDELDADRVPDGPIYLHVDLDVVDAAELPGLLFPVPDGPSADDLAAALGRVADTGRVAAVGVGCTWDPGHGAAERVRAVLEPVLARTEP
ncbi:arginase [Haloactinopolyspora alba]|uniref:Arginase n=1 Tax=Haloactinopolyspora alba TaxID=648780 RepID=A0A2P8E2J0_9ACTN|nr:arginase family protein [Haloactinopolyspora alba]PSL03673.1 arginase [Haloactinopolyspora alba]